jgi:chromosome segregation ATPase
MLKADEARNFFERICNDLDKLYLRSDRQNSIIRDHEQFRIELSRENARLRKDSTELIKNNTELLEQNVKLHEENKQLHKNIEALCGENFQFRKDCALFNEENSRLNNEISQLKTAIHERVTQSQNIQAEKTKLINENEQLRKDETAALDEAERLRRLVQYLQTDNDRFFEMSRNETIRESAQLRKDAATLKDDRANCASEILRLNEKIDQLNKDVAKFETERKWLNDIIEHLQVEAQELRKMNMEYAKADNWVAQNVYQSCVSENLRLSAKVDQLNKVITTMINIGEKSHRQP